MREQPLGRRRFVVRKVGARLLLDIDPKVHPAWTGQHRMVDRGSQLAKFNKRFSGISGKKDEERPLALRKEWITGAPQSFEFMVTERPTRAGIDPYNKLIDRNGDDNTTDISNRF